MKTNFTRIVAILFAVVIIYASCKKVANKPALVQTTDYASLSSNIALNLVTSLNGKYGGTNIKDGIKMPSSLSPVHKSLVLYSPVPLCGYTIDTAFSTSSIAGDTAKTSTGNFNFIYTCTTNSVNGYIVKDSLVNTEAGTTFSNMFMVAQHYTVVALDQTFKLFSINGSIQTAACKHVLNATVVTSYHNLVGFYTLNNLQANITSGVLDVTSGVATFNMTKTDMDTADSPTPASTINTGKIEFLGNHSAKLTIDPSHLYIVNLLTGTVTAI
ncbi:MAG: hypothetical protein JWP44_1357 [Mucilaginibacter sp.]|nr:hypothetical protein [Mucilaginibacter sp.]